MGMKELSFCVIVDCSTAVIYGPYSYIIPNPATIGNSMNVNCNLGLVWSTVPYSSSHTAICSNISNSGTWIVNPTSNCVGVCFATNNSNICKIFIWKLCILLESTVFALC